MEAACAGSRTQNVLAAPMFSSAHQMARATTGSAHIAALSSKSATRWALSTRRSVSSVGAVRCLTASVVGLLCVGAGLSGIADILEDVQRQVHERLAER